MKVFETSFWHFDAVCRGIHLIRHVKKELQNLNECDDYRKYLDTNSPFPQINGKGPMTTTNIID